MQKRRTTIVNESKKINYGSGVKMDFLFIIFVLVYAYAGDQANYYLKYHIMGVRAEVYSNTGDYTLDRFIWAAILGWATIPIAILHYVFIQSKNETVNESLPNTNDSNEINTNENDDYLYDSEEIAQMVDLIKDKKLKDLTEDERYDAFNYYEEIHDRIMDNKKIDEYRFNAFYMVQSKIFDYECQTDMINMSPYERSIMRSQIETMRRSKELKQLPKAMETILNVLLLKTLEYNARRLNEKDRTTYMQLTLKQVGKEKLSPAEAAKYQKLNEIVQNTPDEDE